MHQKLDLSWADNLSSFAVKALVTRCHQLRVLKLRLVALDDGQVEHIGG